MYKSCSKCGKIHNSNYKCNMRLFIGGDERRLRSQYVWTKKSKEIRHKAQHLCEVCRDRGVYTYRDIEVHHIEKIKDNKSKFLDDENLICLCKEHHKQADQGEIDSNYLIELARKREQR